MFFLGPSFLCEMLTIADRLKKKNQKQITLLGILNTKLDLTIYI